MNRRDFLQYTSLVPLAGMAPGAFAAGQDNRPDQILLMVELKGGNDGLNTLVPINNDHYHRLRPAIGLNSKQVISIKEIQEHLIGQKYVNSI